MTVKRLNGKRRILEKVTFNPYADNLPNFSKDNGVKVVKGLIPRAVLDLFNYNHQCAVCGFYERKGVVTGSGFICLRDFENPDLYMEAKRIFSNGQHPDPRENLLQFTEET